MFSLNVIMFPVHQRLHYTGKPFPDYTSFDIGNELSEAAPIAS